jgi:hypothetical protein
MECLEITTSEEPLGEDGYDALVEWLKDQVVLREPRVLRSTLEPARCLRYLNGQATRFWHSSLLKPSARSHLSHCRLQPPALVGEAWAFVADCLETYTWLPLHSELIESFSDSVPIVLPLSSDDALVWQPPGHRCSLKRLADLSPDESRGLIKQVPLSTMAHLAITREDCDTLVLSYNNKAVRIVVPRGGDDDESLKLRVAHWTLPRFYQFTPAHVFLRLCNQSDMSDGEDLV